MPTNDELKRAAQRVSIVSKAAEVAREPVPKVQLNMHVDARIKAALQRAYGRNLTKIFEEMAIERLKRDGYLKVDDEAG
jgi:hypothetical protein